MRNRFHNFGLSDLVPMRASMASRRAKFVPVVVAADAVPGIVDVDMRSSVVVSVLGIFELR